MGIFAGLGFAQALCLFLLGASTALVTYFSSQTLHKVRLLLSIHHFVLIMPTERNFPNHPCTNVLLRYNPIRSNHEPLF